jgi:hypothetical protein
MVSIVYLQKYVCNHTIYHRMEAGNREWGTHPDCGIASRVVLGYNTGMDVE